MKPSTLQVPNSFDNVEIESNASDRRRLHGSVCPVNDNVLKRISEVDLGRLNTYRLTRFRNELKQRDYAGALLADPVNILYATGTQNMSLWSMHSPGRYAFVPAEGPVILFDYASTIAGNPKAGAVDDLRASTPWFHFLAGPRVQEKAEQWAREIASLVSQYGGKNRRLAVDRCEPWGAQILGLAGIELFDAQVPIELARVIKSPEEISCLQIAMEVCDIGVERMRQSIHPGLTENQLWSVLHETNIAHGGGWIECRLLASGERTNPWYQECGNRIINAGDMVAFDTDMVGPFGYLADISRSFVCPGKRATDYQKRLYKTAEEQILFNTDLIKPGVSFREFSEKSWKVPDAYFPRRYTMMVHGVGLVDEYPSVAFQEDFKEWGYDGTFEENMVLSVESFIGEEGGAEGVKLEQQVLVTKSGATVMSRSAMVDALEVE